MCKAVANECRFRVEDVLSKVWIRMLPPGHPPRDLLNPSDALKQQEVYSYDSSGLEVD